MSSQSVGIDFTVRADAAAAAAMSRLAAETAKATAAQEKLNKTAAARQSSSDSIRGGRANDRVSQAKTDLLANYTAANKKKVDQAYAAKADLDLANEVRAAREEQKKAARAERAAAKDAQDLKKKRGESFLGKVEAAEKRLGTSQRIKEELIARGVIADPQLKEAAKKRETAMRQQASGQKALLAGLLGQAGLGAGVSTFGNVTALGEAANLAGYGGLGSALGKAALPLAAGAAIGSGALTASRLSQDEYMTGEQRGRAFLKSNAVSGFFVDAVDNFSGRARAMERAGEQAQLRGQVTGVDLQRNEFAQNIAQQRAIQKGGVAGAASLQGVFRGSTARDTVSSKIEYDQESRMLPLRKQTAKAAQEFTAAKFSAVNAQVILNSLETDGARLEEKRAGLARRLQNVGSGPVQLDILNQLKDNDERIRGNVAQTRTARDFASQQVQRREDARSGVNAAKLAERGGELENLRMLEKRSAGQASNLALLGPAGRIQGDIAMQVVEAFGIENAPPEIVQQAAAKYPEKIAALAEKGGEQFRADAAIYSDEYAGSLASRRKAVDDKEASNERQGVANEQDAAGRQVLAINEAGKAIVDFGRLVRQVVDQFDKDQQQRRSAQN